MTEEPAIKEVIIYTDGGCSPNPGPGAWGAILKHGKNIKHISGGFKLTTNNRMEIMAVIEALKALKCRCSVKLYTDSQYVYNSVTKGWAQKWRNNNWRKGKGNKEKAQNPDLWETLLDLLEEHEVELNWVKAHIGIAGNEAVDRLVNQTRDAGNLGIDEYYLKNKD